MDLDEVSLGGMGPGQSPVGTLPQWLHRHSVHGSVNRLTIPASVAQQPTEKLQRVQHPLPDPLTLKDHPLVVPARQQLSHGAGPIRDAQVTLSRLPGNQPIPPLTQLIQVRGDSITQVDAAFVGLQHRDAGGAKPV